MNRTPQRTTAQRRGSFWLPAAAILSASLLHGTAIAQVPVDENGEPLNADVSLFDGVDVENPGIAGETYSAIELEDLVGQIALYPDDLLAVVLPASTYPLEIVKAARFLQQADVDSSLKPDEDWDDSIVALLNYPDVLNMMNDDLDWTWQLGEAVAQQQSEVILAIETFRDRAYAAGNLKTDERQVVSLDDEGVIEIEPVAEDVIYVPYYEPERVVYQSPTPVYFYHPRAYPVYHYPYPRDHYLTDRMFWGVTTAFTIGWTSNYLNVYHHSYLGHPFYGRRYNFAGAYWRRPSINIYNNWYANRRSPHFNNRHRRGDRWRPRYRQHGARPGRTIAQSRYRREAERAAPNGRRNAQDLRRIEERGRLRTRSADSINARDRRTNGTSYNAGLRRPAAAARPERNARNRNSDEIRFRSRGTDGAYSTDRRQRVTNARRSNDAARINAARDRAKSNRTSVRSGETRSRARERKPMNSIQQRRTTNRSTTPRRAVPQSSRQPSRQPARVSQPKRQRASVARAPSRSVQRSANRRTSQPRAAIRQAAPRSTPSQRVQRPAAAPRRSNNGPKNRPRSRKPPR